MSSNSEYISKNHSKYMLQVHLIFVIKYRKKLLKNLVLADNLKQILFEICVKERWLIKTMEVDKDHIHILLSYPPTKSIFQIVKHLKQLTTWRLWQKFETYLLTQFWKERTFWSDGYFACSIGQVSEATIKKYIENQG